MWKRSHYGDPICTTSWAGEHRERIEAFAIELRLSAHGEVSWQHQASSHHNGVVGQPIS
jgi:hypothetical protein